jgi:hypothetical protein
MIPYATKDPQNPSPTPLDGYFYSGHWDFWSHVPESLDELRQRWSIPRLEPAMAALDASNEGGAAGQGKLLCLRHACNDGRDPSLERS